MALRLRIGAAAYRSSGGLLFFFVRVGRFVCAAATPEGVEELAEPMVTFGMFPLLVLLG